MSWLVEKRKGCFGCRTKLGHLGQRPESAAGISQRIRCFPPTPTGLGAASWWPRGSETARQEAASSDSPRRCLSEALRGETTPSALHTAVTSRVWQPLRFQAAPRTEGTEVHVPSNRRTRASRAGDTQPAVATESRNGVVRRHKWKVGLLWVWGFSVFLFFLVPHQNMSDQS